MKARFERILSGIDVTTVLRNRPEEDFGGPGVLEAGQGADFG